MATYTWSRENGVERRLEGVASVVFGPAHVRFYDVEERLLLAEPNQNVHHLQEHPQTPPEPIPARTTRKRAAKKP